MIERIRVGVQKIQQFTADASHELRTPLTILRGEMEVVLRKQREASEYRQVLQSGLQELEWMEKIVNDLLLLSRADVGELKLNKKKVMMNRLLRELVNQQKTIAESNGLSILPHIFDRFYRVDKARSRGQHGSGLGLSISKSLVEAHGGRIEIESAVKEGTTVNVWLPRGL